MVELVLDPPGGLALFLTTDGHVRHVHNRPGSILVWTKIELDLL
jgi:hypothetical protein